MGTFADVVRDYLSDIQLVAGRPWLVLLGEVRVLRLGSRQSRAYRGFRALLLSELGLFSSFLDSEFLIQPVYVEHYLCFIGRILGIQFVTGDSGIGVQDKGGSGFRRIRV